MINLAPTPGAQRDIIMRRERLVISCGVLPSSLELFPWRVQRLNEERY